MHFASFTALWLDVHVAPTFEDDLVPVHFFLEDKRPVDELSVGVLGLFVFFIVKIHKHKSLKIKF